MTRLHHVNVVVAPGRTDAVVPFYELLGLVRVAKQHFAVSVADLDDVVRRLRDQGHEWTERAALYGARRGMTADPEGNAVEVIEATGPFA